jgi:DUF4097 and DUF4098 domain-containing protein YvlB
MTWTTCRLRPLLVVLALAGTATGCAVDAQIATATGSFSRQLTVSGPVDLEVKTGSGSIEIRRGEANTVQVAGEIRAQRGFWNEVGAEERIRAIESAPPIQQTGNAIRLGELDERIGRNVSISYIITVPAATRVRSQTGSGSHRNDSLAGPVEAETGSGSIRVGEIGTSVTASTGSGSIDVRGAQQGLTARTGSGSITARGARGVVHAQTGSGGIDIEGSPTANWVIETGSGGVSLRVPTNAAFEVDARSSSGSVRTAHPIETTGAVSQRRLQGRIRGGGPRVEVSTGSGSIRLD